MRQRSSPNPAKPATFLRTWGFLIVVMLAPIVVFGGCGAVAYVSCGGLDLDERGAIYPVPDGATVRSERAFTDGSYERNAHLEVVLDGLTTADVAAAYAGRGVLWDQTAGGQYSTSRWPGRGAGEFSVEEVPATSGTPVRVSASRVVPCSS